MSASYYRFGRGRSFGAETAEGNGLRPWTRFAREWGLRRSARELLDPAEWHHVGKYACGCDYYSPDDLPELFEEHPEAFTPRGRALIRGMLAETAAQEAEAIAASLAAFKAWTPAPIRRFTFGQLVFRERRSHGRHCRGRILGYRGHRPEIETWGPPAGLLPAPPAAREGVPTD